MMSNKDKAEIIEINLRKVFKPSLISHVRVFKEDEDIFTLETRIYIETKSGKGDYRIRQKFSVEDSIAEIFKCIAIKVGVTLACRLAKYKIESIYDKGVI